MALSDAERETIVSYSDADDIAYIYTAQRKVITQLKKNRAVKILEEGEFEGSAFLKCELPAKLINFRNPVQLTEQQKTQRANSMRATRDRQLKRGPYAPKPKT
jgi:hypothetical protein